MEVLQTSYLLLLVILGTSSACDLYTFGPCDEQCGGGIQQAITSMCNSTSGNAAYPCQVIAVACNNAPCDVEFSDWNNCSATCGYGERTRTNTSGFVQTMSCNLISCDPVDCDNGAADIVFVVDKSSSITEYGFEIYKQLVSDVVSMLPVGGSVRVAMVSFSSEASTVFGFTNSPSASGILGVQFTGGVGIVAYGLGTAADLFLSSVNIPKIAVFLTDGQQMLLEACANDLSIQLQQRGVEMFAVGIGASNKMKLNPISSPPFNEHQFQAGYNSTARKLANAILNITCGQSDLLTIIDDDENTFNPNKAGLMHAGIYGMSCTEWSAWSECSESCGKTGYRQRFKKCTDMSGEIVITYKFGECFNVCPTEPTNEPDCNRCDYTKGQIWLPDSQNCHDYYICEKVDTWAGRWYWTYHHVSCGLLYWDQSRLTCTAMIQPGCKDQPGNDIPQPDLSGVPCPYRPVAGYPRKFRSIADGTEQQCVDGMMYEPLICGCLQVSSIDPTCSDDLLLYFPYEVDFDDVTCHHAKGYAYGNGKATIVTDINRGNVVHFDGNVRIEVPFMRNWFKDQCTRQFTMMFWFKRDPGNSGKVGLVHNGDCVDPPTFLVQGDESPLNDKQVVGGVDTVGSGLMFTNPSLVSDGIWHHVSLVYDGASLSLYVDGSLAETEPKSGCIDNVQNAMIIGALGCCAGQMGFFEGYIDDLRVFTRAVPP